MGLILSTVVSIDEILFSFKYKWSLDLFAREEVSRGLYKGWPLFKDFGALWRETNFLEPFLQMTYYPDCVISNFRPSLSSVLSSAFCSPY